MTTRSMSRRDSCYDSRGWADTVKKLTVRGFDKELERRLRDVARTKGVSLNQAALILLLSLIHISEPTRRS